MPTVPVEENRVGIANMTDAKLRAPDMSGTGLEAFGAGAQQVGKAGAEFAQAQDEHDRKLEQAAARTIDTGLVRTIMDRGEAFKGLNGLQAPAALPSYLQDLDKLGRDTLAQAPSKRMRAMLEVGVNERVLMAREAAMDHARQQGLVATEEAYASRVSASGDAALNATTEHEFDIQVSTGQSDTENYWSHKGVDSSVAAEKGRKWASGVYTARALLLSSTGRFDEAQAFYKANRARFVGDDAIKVQTAWQPIIERREDNADLDRRMGATNPDGSAPNFTDPIRGAGHPPVVGGQYGAGRDYGFHKGVDRPAPIGTPVYSGHGPGTATVTSSHLGGNIISIHHDDGYTTKYMHLGSVRIASGARVDATTILGTVGMTGRATGPNLHYEVMDKSGAHVDPTRLATTIRQGATRVNLDGVLASLDADTSLTPEQRDRRKELARARIGVSDQILDRQYQDASNAADKWLLTQKPGEFTSVSQMPGNIYAALKPDQQVQWRTMADANLKAQSAPPAANGNAIVMLHRLQYENPTQFAQSNLEKYRGLVAPGEFDQLATDQAKLRAQPREGAKYSQIFEGIRVWGGGVADTAPKRQNEAADVYQARQQNTNALADTMRRYLERLVGFDQNHKITEDDIHRAYQNATLRRVQPDGTYQPRYKLNLPNSVYMSQADEARIKAQLVRQGMAPTPENVTRVYMMAAVGGGR